MKEHLFIIKYTNENGWEWDTDTEAVRLDDGTIYDTETQQWEPAYLDGEYADNDDEVGEKLGAMLQIANDAKRMGL
jgi:hypothetical protein